MAELKDRDNQEAGFARNFGRLAGRHRRELLSLLGHPPDPDRVPAEFWDKVRRETEEETMAILLLIFIASATQHGAERGDAQARGLIYAQQRAATIATSYAKTSREMLDVARS